MMKRRIKSTRLAFIFFLILAWTFIGLPRFFNFLPEIQEAQASDDSDDDSDSSDDDSDSGDDDSDSGDDDSDSGDDDSSDDGAGDNTSFTAPPPPPPNFQGSIIQKPRAIR